MLYCARICNFVHNSDCFICKTIIMSLTLTIHQKSKSLHSHSLIRIFLPRLCSGHLFWVLTQKWGRPYLSHYFSFSIWKMLLHYHLVSVVSNETSTVILCFFVCNVTFFFPLAALKIFLFIKVISNLIMLVLGVIFFRFFVLGFFELFGSVGLLF